MFWRKEIKTMEQNQALLVGFLSGTIVSVVIVAYFYNEEKEKRSTV